MIKTYPNLSTMDPLQLNTKPISIVWQQETMSPSTLSHIFFTITQISSAVGFLTLPPHRISELEVAVHLHAEGLKHPTSFVCETWIFPWSSDGLKFLSDSYTEFYSRVAPESLSPTVLLRVNGDEADKTNFSYSREFTELDLLYPTRFGFRRLSPNCVTLLIPLLHQEGYRSGLETTTSMIVTKTGRPHKDYFVYIGDAKDVNNLLADEEVKDIRFKYGFIPTGPTLINPCERKGEKLAPFSRKCDSHITNRHFKVSSCFIAPLVSYENNPNDSRKWGRGMIFSMFLEASVQNNFTFDIRYAHYNGASGFRKDGKWYGAVGEVYSREADIACAVAPTSARNVIADASVMQLWMVRIFFIRQPAFSTSWQSLFWSLDPLVWLGIIVLMVVLVIPATYFIALSYFKSTNVELKTGQQSLIIEVVEATYRVLMEQAATCRHWRGSRIRIILMLWTLFCLVLRTGYSSKLIVFLSFLQQAPLPETHRELSLTDYRLYFRYYGGVAYNYMNTSKDPMHKRILPRASLINSSDECMIAAISTPRSACLDYRLSGEYATQQKLTINPHEENQLFVQSKDTDVKIHIIWSYRKGSPLTESFDKVLLRMLAGGLYEIWKQINWHQARQEGAIYTRNHSHIKGKIIPLIADLSKGPKPLSNKTMTGLYLQLVIGFGTALFALVWELLAHFSTYLDANLEASSRLSLFVKCWENFWGLSFELVEFLAFLVCGIRCRQPNYTEERDESGRDVERDESRGDEE